ncbi:MAG: hypothetical protein M3O70_15755 [Actinomycetota bacterium]|nr:hypothetical protein [Actinomycetota bacterium]
MSGSLDVRRILELTSAFFGVMFVVLYGIGRPAYSLYYERFGLTPDDVGITEVGVVVRLGFAVALVIAVFVIAVMAAYLEFRFGVDVLEPLRPQPSGPRADFWVLAAASTPAIPVFLVAVLFPWTPIGLLAGLVFMGMGLGWALLGWHYHLRTQDRHGRLRSRVSRVVGQLFQGERPALSRPAVVVSLAALVALVGSTYLDFAAEKQANAVLRTGETTEDAFTVFVLGIRADPARIIPLGQDPLRICDGRRSAVLIGRKDTVSYVLLRGESAGDPSGRHPEVVPLPLSEYVVVTGIDQPQVCAMRTRARGQ